ncbi:MAG: hypothetical protein FWG68_12695 [Defluviitaleaceae bacterium]|nr:hypothetical protein [Defluviitaleaceae bacterium]
MKTNFTKKTMVAILIAAVFFTQLNVFDPTHIFAYENGLPPPNLTQEPVVRYATGGRIRETEPINLSCIACLRHKKNFPKKTTPYSNILQTTIHNHQPPSNPRKLGKLPQ